MRPLALLHEIYHTYVVGAKESLLRVALVCEHFFRRGMDTLMGRPQGTSPKGSKMSNGTKAPAGLVPCPLGANCLTRSKTGHEPGSTTLSDCQAAASAQGNAKSVVGNPSEFAYKPKGSKYRRLEHRIKRAFGAEGRGIPNLIGPPGIGKSDLVKNMAVAMNADFTIFDVSSIDPDTFNGIPYDSKEDTGDRVKIAGRLYDREVYEMFYRDDKRDKPLLVFLDEINGGKEELMSSLQKVLTGRALPQEGKELNPNVFFIAAQNDADHTSNGSELAAAMISRLTPIEMRPDFEEWTNGEMTNWGKPYDQARMDSVAAALGENAPSEEQYLEARATVIGFLKQVGNADMATGDSKRDAENLFSEPIPVDDPSRKVAQPRSWSKVASSFASLIANPMDGEDSPTERAAVMTSIVHDACSPKAAKQFQSWYVQHGVLPDMDKAISTGSFGGEVNNWKAEGRVDVAMYTAHIIGTRGYSDLKEVENAMNLMGEISEAYPDVVGSKFPNAVAHFMKSEAADKDKEGVSALVRKTITDRPEIMGSTTASNFMDQFAKGKTSLDGMATSIGKNSTIKKN